jgi:hypothetical protein
MNRLAILTILLLLAASCGPVAAHHHRQRIATSPQHVDWQYPDSTIYDGVVEPTQDYFPLQVGTTWTYQLPSVPGTKLVNKVVKHEMIDGVLCAKLETSMNGNVLANEHIGVTKDGICRFRINGAKIEKPVLILKLPAKTGDSWAVKSKVGNETISGTMKTTEERVEVPAGKFKALVAGGKMEGNGQTVEVANYFVKGVGIAKIKMDLAGQVIEVDLEKFEPAK